MGNAVVGILGGTIPSGLDVAGHLSITSPTPSVTAGGQAGTNPPAPVRVAGSRDGAGQITWGTGTLPSSGAQVSLTFGSAWVVSGGGAPHMVLSPLNAATQALGPYLTSISPTGFIVAVASAPAAGQGNTTYAVGYVVMG